MKRLLTSLCLVVLIGLKLFTKILKGNNFVFLLKMINYNLEKVKKLEEYSGLEGTAVFDYCAKIGVIGMTTESEFFIHI